MNLEKAMVIIQAKDKPVPWVPPPQPGTATLWGVGPDEILQEGVYFAYSAGLVKIGYAMTPRRRLAELTAGAAMPVTMVLIVPGSEKDERKFHERFAEDRVHHEWFRLSKRMRDFFRARLCPIGRASLKQAQEQFVTYCKETTS